MVAANPPNQKGYGSFFFRGAGRVTGASWVMMFEVDDIVWS